MFLEDAVQTLQYLGLSVNQAKVYYTISSTKFLSVNEIKQKSNVPRQDIYRILDSLTDLGLVECSINRPKKYRAISMKEGVSFLLKQKRNEMSKMKKMAEELIEDSRHSSYLFSPVDPDFVIIPKNHATILRRGEEISNADTQIDFLISWKRFPRTIETFGDVSRMALENGVKIRVLLEKPENLDHLPQIVDELKAAYPNYELKFISDEPSAVIAIFDKKRVIIDTSTDTELAEKPSLLTNNPSLVSIIIDYYERIWDNH